MNTSYTLTEAEVIKAMQFHCRGSNKTLIVLAVISIALILLGVFTEYKAIGFGSAISGLISYFSLLFILVPFNAKRQYKQLRALRTETSVSVSAQGFNSKSESGESNLQWRDIHHWKYGKGVFLLYLTSNMFLIVPSRALANENELIKLLDEYIGPRKA